MENWLVEQLKAIRAFRVDADGYDWFSYPDVVLEIVLDAPPTPEQTTAAVTTLTEFVNGYNKWHFLRPIHYVAEIGGITRVKHPRGIYIHMDFGHSPATALVAAVKSLEKTELPIFRVTLQW